MWPIEYVFLETKNQCIQKFNALYIIIKKGNTFPPTNKIIMFIKYIIMLKNVN